MANDQIGNGVVFYSFSVSRTNVCVKSSLVMTWVDKLQCIAEHSTAFMRPSRLGLHDGMKAVPAGI